MSTQARDSLQIGTLTPPGAQQRWRQELHHAAPEARLILITKGQGRITIAGLPHGYGPGSLIWLPAGTLHALEIGPLVFGQMLRLSQPAGWPALPLALRLRDPAQQKELVFFLDQIDRESQPAGSAEAAGLWAQLLALAVSRAAAVADPASLGDPRRQSPAARLVARYSGLLASPAQQDCSIARYAADLGVTPTHLARCCQQVSGLSPLALAQEVLHHRACLLLRDTALPVQQVAQMLGFRTAAYFTRRFHDRTGQTPSQFRRGLPVAPAARKPAPRAPRRAPATAGGQIKG